MLHYVSILRIDCLDLDVLLPIVWGADPGLTFISAFPSPDHSSPVVNPFKLFA